MNVFATSPAHAPARAARAQLEEVAAALRETTAPIDRRGIADRLMRAIRALYAVIDTPLESPAHHDGLVECARVLGEARQLLAPFAQAPEPALARAWGALEAIHGAVRRAGDEVVDVMLARRGDLRAASRGERPVRAFRVSAAVPTLHALARSPLAPALALDALVPVARRPKRPPPPDKPTTLDALRAAAAAAVAPPAPPAFDDEPAPAPPLPPTDDGELLRRVARDCLEDIASLRGLRKPIPSETWLDQAPFEQRLLDNVDAFVAFGDAALPSVMLFHAEAPAPDPARAFAVALTLGCIEGTDTADVAIGALEQSPPAELSGFVEGFLLSPSPAIDVEIAPLLDASNPALVGAALDVLGARGTLPLDAPERVLARRDPTLTARLAAALGRALPKARATQVLVTLLDEQPSDELFAIVCSSLLRRGDGDVRQRLRDAIQARVSRERVATATRLLALAGRPDDVALLIGGLSAAPTPGVVRAIGRHGHVDALGILVAHLDAKDPEIVAAAAEALDAMTNAGLGAACEVPWTPGYVPPEGGPPPTRKITKPIADRLVWERWLADARRRLDPRQKLRSGLPFSPGAIADELEGPSSPERREEAAFELVIATGLGVRFSTTDWVAKQKQQLEELRSSLRTLASTPGGWWYAGSAITSR